MARNPHPCGDICARSSCTGGHHGAPRRLSRLSIDPAPRAADTSRVLAVAALAAPFDRDVDAALARIAHHAERAREQGARLLVLPESALGGYLREPGPDEMAPDVPAGLAPDGPGDRRLIALAGDLVSAPATRELGARRAVRVGDLRERRRRARPPAQGPPAARRALRLHGGRRLRRLRHARRPARDAALLRQALPRGGARAGARRRRGPVLAVGLAGRPPSPRRRIRDDRQTRHFDLCDRARAVENQVFVVSANQTGRWGPLRFLGSAKVVDPDGAVLARTGAARGSRWREVDLAAVARSRIGHRPSRRPAARGVRGAVRRGRGPRLRRLTGRVARWNVRHRRGARRRAVPAAGEPVTDRDELLAGTRETLVRAVREQMMGDVNVGVFLSGGLDSSLVAAIASRIANERGRRLQTFAVGTEASADLAAARTVADAPRLRPRRGHLHGGRGARVAAQRRARDRVVRPRPRAQRGAELHARPHHPPARQGRAHRRGRRRAVRRLRLHARVHGRRRRCTPSSSAPCARCTTSTCSAATA